MCSIIHAYIRLMNPVVLKTKIGLPFFDVNVFMCFISKNAFSLQGNKDIGVRFWKPLLTCGSFLKLFICHKHFAKGDQGGKDS